MTVAAVAQLVNGGMGLGLFRFTYRTVARALPAAASSIPVVIRLTLVFILQFLFSLLPEPIEAVGAVHLHGFAEMDKSIGKRDGLQRKPNRAGQIGAGFDQDGNIGCASDVESKLIAMQAETGVNLASPVWFPLQAITLTNGL